MQVAYYEKTGSARDVLSVGERPEPAPGPGEVRVRLHCSGVNPSDVKSRAGRRNSPMSFPLVGGCFRPKSVGRASAVESPEADPRRWEVLGAPRCWRSKDSVGHPQGIDRITLPTTRPDSTNSCAVAICESGRRSAMLCVRHCSRRSRASVSCAAARSSSPKW